MVAMQIAEPMSLRALLIGLRGRVGRRTWWLWGIVMPLGMALYFTVLLRVVGLAPRHADMVVNLLLFWPTLAVSVKRWHDRNKSGWWTLVFLWAPGVTDRLSNKVIEESAIWWILFLIGAVLSLWGLIELGFRRGTDGENDYGPDPIRKPEVTAPAV